MEYWWKLEHKAEIVEGSVALEIFSPVRVDYLWIFTPEIGCKLSLPQRWISDGSFRLCIRFPAMVGSRSEFIKSIKPFQPRISIGVDLLMMYAELYLGGK